MRSLHQFGVALTLALAACSSGTSVRPAAKTSTPASRMRDAEKLRDLARFAPALPSVEGNRDYDVESYTLAGRFNWDLLRLEARVDIQLKLADAATTSLQLDSRVSDVLGVRIGEATPNYSVDKDAGTLTVDLGKLTPEERASKLVVAIDYVRKATEDGASGEHFDGSALRAIAPRLGDPNTARTVNTMSEPRSASQWMPCKDDVADRATFAVELTLPKDEALIANGNLIKDEHLADGSRVMGYRTQYTLPTYLMAFAAGEFNVAMTELNGLPIGVWSRRGLPVDSTGVIENLRRLITRYTELMGPFAFDKYVIVFLPEFGGGEEHAGITFQNEADGSDTTGAGDRSMIGHELGHQWFGDYMTVKTWDDLWIKEGMASVLEAESNRPWEDQTATGNLFGGLQFVKNGDAIIDPTLSPDDKYTSGPYGRAAWLLTQIRATTGEEAFWATLRKTLQDHAYGNITTAQFLDEFRPLIGDALIAKIEIALKARALPTIAATKAEDGGVHLTLTDTDQALVVPFTLARLGEHGSESVTLTPGSDYVIASGDHRSTIFDPRGVHCHEVHESAAATYEFLTAPLAATELLTLSSVAQVWALNSAQDWQVAAEDYINLKDHLAGEIAKAKALQKACRTAQKESEPAKRFAWAKAIDESLLDLPLLGLSSWYADTRFVNLSECLSVASPGVLDSTWARIRSNSDAFATRAVEFEALSAINRDPEQMLATWAPAARNGTTLRLKVAATSALFRVAPTEAVPTWQSFFRDLLATNHTSDVLRFAIKAVVQSKDQEALPLLADVVKTVDSSRLQQQAVCSAREITAETDGSFARFATPLLALETLPVNVRDALTNPESCNSDR